MKDIDHLMPSTCTVIHAIPRAYTRRVGVISNGRYFRWALFWAGVISNGRYFEWALFWAGVIWGFYCMSIADRKMAERKKSEG